MKNFKLFLLIVVLAVITFLMIKSVEEHYHAVHDEVKVLPVTQK
jgi:hypothetical protein